MIVYQDSALYRSPDSPIFLLDLALVLIALSRSVRRQSKSSDSFWKHQQIMSPCVR
jgi:hypothetical protein